MNSPRIFSPRVGRSRCGLSFVEFIGCLLALGSGVAIGSVYLGVDMKTLFVGILERAELVDPGFFGGKAVAQQITPAPDSSAATPLNMDVATSETETATATPEAMANSETPPAAQAAEVSAESPTAENTAATVNYWQGLTAIISAEKLHRSKSSLDIENWQLFDYLTLRREGHRQAVESIEKIDENGVDERLLAHGHQVLSWHQAGAKLYGRAVDLLTDAPSDQLTGPFAQSWQSSATQHRMEEKLVREKHLSVAGYLDHTFKDQAPFKPAF